MPESRPDHTAKPTSSPDELVKDLDVTLTEEEQHKVKGGASDIFAKIGDIKGESLDDKHRDAISALSRSPLSHQLKQ